MKTIRLLAILLIILASASVVYAGTIEVPVSQIALISPGNREPDLSLGPRLCLKFNLPEDIRGVEIGYADLVIHHSLPVVTDDSLALFEAFTLSTNWSEGAGWGDFPIPGGNVDSNYYAVYTHRCGTDSLISLDVTTMAQNWNDNLEANHGLIIIPRKSDWNAFRQFRPLPEQIRGMITLNILVPGRRQ